jgi:hypothetical protein
MARAFNTTPVVLQSSVATARGEPPTIELAKTMPRGFCDMSNEALCAYAAQVSVLLSVGVSQLHAV